MIKSPKAFFFAIITLQLFIIVSFWFWDHVNHPMGNLLIGEPFGQFLAYGRLHGLLLAFLILLQILIISRAKLIERSFGHDRLTHAHGVLGFSIILLLILHPVLLVIGQSIQTESTYYEQFIDYCKNWEDVLQAVIGFCIICSVIIVSFLVTIKRIKYETWYYMHLSLYIAVLLSFGHQLAVGEDFNSNQIFTYYWYFIYAFVFTNLIFYRFLKPIFLLHKHRFRVVEIVRETNDVTSIYIDGLQMNSLHAKAGQFIFLRFLAKGFIWEKHPFSISGLSENGRIRVSIKALGNFTKRIPDLAIGTYILIDGPYGIFTSRNCTSSNVLMIAGGIGITPIRSLIEEMVKNFINVVLLYSNRHSNNIVFKNELDKLEKSSLGHLKIIHVISDDLDWEGEKGRIDREKLSRLVPDLNKREVYLCGPLPMMKTIRKTLSNLNILRSNIHFEKFSL